MKPFPFTVPPEKQARVILDTDCACEADDQFAVAHALMSPKMDVVAIHSAHFAERFGQSQSEQKSYDEICNVLSLLQPASPVPVYHGAPAAMPDEQTPVPSPAAENLIAEAMKDDPRPLFVTVQGAATNVASALLLRPEIANRITVVWIGGGTYPLGESEFNVENDIAAANVLLASEAELWQVPKNVYSSLFVPISTLLRRVKPCGRLGEYLVRRVLDTQAVFVREIKRPTYTKGAAAASYPGGEMWILGDQPSVALILFDQRYHFHSTPAPRILPNCSYVLQPDNPRVIRVYDCVDCSFIMEDFYEKLAYHCGS